MQSRAQNDDANLICGYIAEYQNYLERFNLFRCLSEYDRCFLFLNAKLKMIAGILIDLFLCKLFQTMLERNR